MRSRCRSVPGSAQPRDLSNARTPSGRGRGFGPSPGATVAKPDVPPGRLDPVTDELIDDDWEFTIWLDAIPEDYPLDEEDGD